MIITVVEFIIISAVCFLVWAVLSVAYDSLHDPDDDDDDDFIYRDWSDRGE